MPKTLLLADDSINFQKVVGITFATEDYVVTAVDNGEDALARARESRPDVILADVVMPRRNGYELCQAVKSDPALQGVPVLLLAGTFEAFDENRARAARADGHIAKPFESGALIAKVKELVAGVADLAKVAVDEDELQRATRTLLAQLVLAVEEPAGMAALVAQAIYQGNARRRIEQAAVELDRLSVERCRQVIEAHVARGSTPCARRPRGCRTSSGGGTSCF